MKPFIKVSLALMAAKAVVNKKTGDMLVFTDSDKDIYCWMFAQYKQLLSQDKEFFHNQEFIRKATYKSLSGVEKFVRKFVAAGIVHRKQMKIPSKGSIVSNSYKVEDLDDDSLFEYVFDDDLDETYRRFITSDVSVKPLQSKKQNKTGVHTTFAQEIDDYPF